MCRLDSGGTSFGLDNLSVKARLNQSLPAHVSFGNKGKSIDLKPSILFGVGSTFHERVPLDYLLDANFGIFNVSNSSMRLIPLNIK